MYWDTVIKPGHRHTDGKDSKVKVGSHLSFIDLFVFLFEEEGGGESFIGCSL